MERNRKNIINKSLELEKFKKQDLKMAVSNDGLVFKSWFVIFWDFLSSDVMDYLPMRYRVVKNKHVHLFFLLLLVNWVVWKYLIFPRTDKPIWDFFFTFLLAFVSVAVMFKIIEKVESRVSSQ